MEIDEDEGGSSEEFKDDTGFEEEPLEELSGQ